MPAIVHQDQSLPNQLLCGLLLRCSEDAVLGTPKHLDRQLRQGVSNAGKAAAAGKASQRLPPSRCAQVKAGDLLFCRSDCRIRVGKGLPAEATADGRQAKKCRPKTVQQRW